MKKNINKIIALLLIAIMCVPTLSVCASSGCYNVLGTRAWSFSESADPDYYIGSKGNTLADKCDFEICDIDGSRALHAYIAKGDSAAPSADSAANAKNVNAATYDNKDNQFTKLCLEFKIKRTSSVASGFGVFLKDYNANQQAEILRMTKTKKLRFMGHEVADYSLNAWYDLKMLIDLDTRMGSIGIKGEGDSEYAYYNVPFSLLCAASSNEANAPSINLTEAGKILYMFLGSDKTVEQNVYITNLKQNTFAAALTREMTYYGQDFEDVSALSDAVMSFSGHQYGDTQISTNRVADSKDNFLLENGAGDPNTSYSIETLSDGNKVLALIKNTGSTKTGQCVQKYLDSSLYKIAKLHRFSFKIGGSKDAADKLIRLRSENNTMPKIIQIKNGLVQIMDGSSWVTVENLEESYNPNHLYECNIYYDTITKKATYSVTDTKGVQYFKSVNLDSDLARLVILNNTSSGAASTMYVDDYAWYVYRDSGTAENAACSIESGLYEDASLDEYAIFDYNEPIDSGKLTEVTVTVKANGTSITPDYSLDAKKGYLEVKLKNLTPSTQYEVSVSSAATLLERTAPDATVSFTTTATTVRAAKPQYTDTAVKTSVTSGYAHGKNGVFIVGLYNSDGVRYKVIAVPFVAERGKECTPSIDLSSESFERAKAFVWSDFYTMEPYGEHLDF